MRWTHVGALAAIVLAASLSASSATAKGNLDGLLEQAAKLEGEAAAKALGKIVPGTKGDLAAERKVADAIERFLEESARAGSAADLQKSIVAVLSGLDAKRSGAFVSAHALAREVLGELRNYFPGKVFRQAIGTSNLGGEDANDAG